MADDMMKKKKLRKEMTNFQKGYDEAIYTQLKYPRPISDIGNTVNRALMSTEREKMGQNKGIEDARAALKYQAEQSMERTNEVRQGEEERRKKMKGK